jgi:hypothetical protein
MQHTHSARWLTEYEASLLLQRFMPYKSAVSWLQHDRRHDPVIPFSNQGGEIVYRSSDLENFVHHHLAPGAQVDFSERRVRVDRRVRVERRHHPDLRLVPSAERRRAHTFDRRGGLAPDRRAERMAA